MRAPPGENDVAPGAAASLQGTVMTSPTHEERRQIFERHFLLGELPRDKIDTLLTYARVERYPAGREIFAKGSPPHSMMAVLRGSVRIGSVSPDGKEIVLNIINAGEVFGEIALLDGRDRTADATAMTDCELLVLNRRDFLPFLEGHADICMKLLKILAQRLRQTSEQVEDMLFRDLGSRIAKALLHLAHSSGRQEPQGVTLDLHLSQRELGNIAGGTRESVNKHLSIWQKAGFIDLSKGSIVIRDIDAIERMV